jgi:hypothetical protein
VTSAMVGNVPVTRAMPRSLRDAEIAGDSCLRGASFVVRAVSPAAKTIDEQGDDPHHEQGQRKPEQPLDHEAKTEHDDHHDDEEDQQPVHATLPCRSTVGTRIKSGANPEWAEHGRGIGRDRFGQSHATPDVRCAARARRPAGVRPLS